MVKNNCTKVQLGRSVFVKVRVLRFVKVRNVRIWCLSQNLEVLRALKRGVVGGFAADYLNNNVAQPASTLRKEFQES